MPKTVRILGNAPNAMLMPLPTSSEVEGGIEMWLANNPKAAHKYLSTDQFDGWTRWFNLHSRHHMETTYPRGFKWYLEQDGTRPFYTQKLWPDIPGCTVFPRERIQAAFPEASHYFTCSIAWLTAFAILEGFERIEFHGIMLRDKPDKGHECYKFERPCFFYWVNKARSLGIEVVYPVEVDELGEPEAGDPSTYDGPLYGYDTKPESA